MQSREGNKRITAGYKYQDQTNGKAKRPAKNYKADVVIHRTYGTIRDWMGYVIGDWGYQST